MGAPTRKLEPAGRPPRLPSRTEIGWDPGPWCVDRQVLGHHTHPICKASGARSWIRDKGWGGGLGVALDGSGWLGMGGDGRGWLGSLGMGETSSKSTSSLVKAYGAAGL